MSWYLFKDAPAVKLRGIKVDGFQQYPLHRPTLNLSWGMNEPPLQNSTQSPLNNIIPATITHNNANEASNKTKILTETSEEEGEELMKLIKNRENNRKGGL